MEQGECLYVIGVGDAKDWQAGRGSIYYVEDRNSEKCMPVFTSPELAGRYVETNLHSPEAHMGMLESIGVSHAEPLTEGRFMIMPLDAVGVAMAAEAVDADYLVRDLRPGEHQEVLRFDK